MNTDDIKTIGIIGGGVMGQGIGQSAILAGYHVIIRDLTDEIIAKTKDGIVNGRYGLTGALQRGKLTQEQVDKALSLLEVTTRIEDMQDVDFLMEAIGGPPGQLENKDLKLQIFAEMDKIVKKEAIFSSNTSYFTIADLAAATHRQDRGSWALHFFSPASVMKGCEVICTAAVLPEIVEAAMGDGPPDGQVSREGQGCSGRYGLCREPHLPGFAKRGHQNRAGRHCDKGRGWTIS